MTGLTEALAEFIQAKTLQDLPPDALDFDGVLSMMPAHPSAVILQALFADPYVCEAI